MIDNEFDIQRGSHSRRSRKIYAVSELNAEIKRLIEDNFSLVWLFGEISNFRIPASGHFYFTLKDEASQINAVMFRGQQRHLKFEPEDGLNVTGMGRIGIYEPRGTYQIILEYLEPAGIGALQIAYEKLKKQLAAEGCFDARHKLSLPFLPKNISVITSPTGAVVHDILKTIERRFANFKVQILPVKVQGPGAVEDIVAALSLLNARKEAEVVILARGGGSLEDLQAFNAEPVARAIFASKIPVVSAVGHQTDYTISDFVADLRAPTPTAAAEMVVPPKLELQRRVSDLMVRLEKTISHNFKVLRIQLNEFCKRLIDPRRKLEDHRLRLDDLSIRLKRRLQRRIDREREYLNLWENRLGAHQSAQLCHKSRMKLEQMNENLLKSFTIYNNPKKVKIRELSAALAALNPLAILARGYSVTRTIPQAAVIKDSRRVSVDQDLEILLAQGALVCRVKGKMNNGKKNV